MASKKNKQAKTPKTATKTAKKKKAPPPKVETRGKRVKVTFEDKDQRDEVVAEDAKRTSFALDEKEIAARSKEVNQILERLKIRREHLANLTRERDATKAEIAATELGQRLEKLKEDIKAEEVVIAGQQSRQEMLTWEVLNKRTFEYQKPLDLEDEGDEAPPAKPKMTQTELPAEAEPPAPAAALALPAATAGVIDGNFEDPAEAVRMSLARDIWALLHVHGPLTTEELCKHLGYEERHAESWQRAQDALLGVLQAVRQEGRWHLPEHLRVTPALAAPPVAPSEPAPAGLLPAPASVPVVTGPQEPEVPLDDLEAPPAATTVAEDAAAIFEALQHAPQWTLSGAQIIGKTDLSVDALAAALDRLHSEGRLVEASMALATAPDVDRLFTLARDEDKVPPPPPSGPKGGKKGRDKAQGKEAAPVSPSAGKAPKREKTAHARADRDEKPETAVQPVSADALCQALKGHGGLAVQALAERLGASAEAVHAGLEALVVEGLVELRRSGAKKIEKLIYALVSPRDLLKRAVVAKLRERGPLDVVELHLALEPHPSPAALQELLTSMVEIGELHQPPKAVGNWYSLVEGRTADAPATPSLDEQVRDAILDELRGQGDHRASDTWLRNRLGKRMATPTYETIGAALEHLVAAGELVEHQYGERRLYTIAPSSPTTQADEDDNRPAPILTPADDARRLLAERGEISGPQELCELFRWDAGDTGQWAAALAALQEVGEKTPHGTWRSRQGSGKQAAE